MSWTVHEDEHRTAEPNLEDILRQAVNNDDGDVRPRPGKYTQSSQVFATSTINTTDVGAMPKEADAGNPWFRTHATPAVNGFPPPHQPQMVPMGKYSRSHRYGMYDPSKPMNHNIGDMYGAPMHRGNMSPTMINNVDHRKNMMSVDDLSTQDSGSLSFQDWSVSYNGKYGGGGGGGGGGNGSPTSPYSNVTAESLRGKVYETAKDQHGCRFLQRWIDTNRNPEAVEVVMKEIIPHVAELMTDQYANFLVQKLFDVMPDDIRYNVAQVAAPKISTIALTPHGTFSVQKMIETISTREEMEIVRAALSKDVVRLVKDTHGNHVIQKVLQRFDYEDKEFIYEAVMSDCVAIAKNKQGCCVLQRCLEYASPTQKSTLIAHILSCCLQVVQDPFGNYVLQYVLEAKDSKINDTIAIAFLPHLVQLCMNKFSSNVMEKVLRGASPHIQEMYVNSMCNPEIVTHLIQDDYGNYVLQTALSICAPSQVDALVNTIRPLMPMIKSAPYAKKLEGKIDAITKKAGSNNGNSYRGSGEYEPISRGGNGSPHKYGNSSPHDYHGNNNNHNNHNSNHNNNNNNNGNNNYHHHHHHRMNHDNRAAPWQPS